MGPLPEFMSRALLQKGMSKCLPQPLVTPTGPSKQPALATLHLVLPTKEELQEKQLEI